MPVFPLRHGGRAHKHGLRAYITVFMQSKLWISRSRAGADAFYTPPAAGALLQHLFYIFRYWRRKNVYKEQRQRRKQRDSKPLYRVSSYSDPSQKGDLSGCLQQAPGNGLPTDPDDIVSVLDAMVNSAGDAPSPFPLFENDALEEALQKLSQRDRYIFLAHALYQRDFGNLASELGLTYQGAATAYHRARQKIKDTLGRNVK